MSYLPATKFGNCSVCPSTNCACIKVGKNLFCVPCHRKNKGQQQVQKANERDKQRRQSTTSTQQNQSTQLRSLINSKVNREVVGEKKEDVDGKRLQWKWFLERRKEMTGVCSCGCGKGTSKKEDKYFHYSIAHILQKSKILSVATHPLNWIELSFWGGCHSDFDNMGSDNWEDMKCFPEIVRRFKIMYPLIPDYEKRWIPKILLNQL